MKGKFLALFFVFALIAIIAATSVLADQWYEYSVPDIEEMSVYVDGELAWYGYCYPDPDPSIDRWICMTYQYYVIGLERGSTIEVKTSFTSNSDLEEVTVHAWITGYREDIEAETNEFDVFSGNTYVKTLRLEIPDDLDARDEYTLYVQIEHKQQLSGIDEAEIDTEVQRIANILDILSVELYDSSSHYRNEFEAGDTIYAEVVVKNRGNYEAEDVYVRVSINELGIKRTAYLGDLEPYDSGDDEDSKEITIALQLPTNIKAGTYTFEAYTYNDEVSDREIRNVDISGYREEQEEQQPGKVEIVTQISSNEVEQGKGAVYTLLVANFGTTTQNFLVKTVGTEGWATTTITPSAFTLAPGQSKLVNIYLAAGEEAVEGEHIFSVQVSYGNEMKQQSLIANVIKSGTKIDWKTILMVIGIVLAVAIIVLLIVLLTRKHEKTETVESYY